MVETTRRNFFGFLAAAPVAAANAATYVGQAMRTGSISARKLGVGRPPSNTYTGIESCVKDTGPDKPYLDGHSWIQKILGKARQLPEWRLKQLRATESEYVRDCSFLPREITCLRSINVYTQQKMAVDMRVKQAIKRDINRIETNADESDWYESLEKKFPMFHITRRL